MSQIKFSNNTSRNAFDLSHKVAFTAKAGELLPIEVKEVIPGDKFVFKPKWFTRTNPLNTAAYTRLTEYVDYYFVPYHLLWNKAEQFFINLPDSQHATGLLNPNNKTYQTHPYFMLSDVINYLRKVDNNFHQGRGGDGVLQARNYFNFNRAWLSAKLLEYLGYGKFTQYLEDYDNYHNDGSEIDLDVDCKLNPFPLLAYQCVYQYYERNTQWEQMRSDFFNIDWAINDAQDLSIYVPPMYNISEDNMFDMRYANYKKDLFTGLMPNAQYGDEAFVTILGETGSFMSYRFASNSGNVSIADMNPAVLNNGQINNGALALNKLQLSGDIGKLSVLALRQAEALQRYKEIKQSNKYDYKSQIEAIWDTNVSKYRAHMPVHIGGFVNGINIDEVVNTSITDNGDTRQAANIAGKGAGAGTGYLEFESKEDFGIVIGIYKVCPEIDYSDLGLSRFHQKTEFSDYANPLFDKLGMEGVNLTELVPIRDVSDYVNDLQNIPNLGYAPRYYDYKTAVDYVKGGFARDSYSQWVTPITGSQLLRNVFNDKPFFNFSNFKINPMVLNSIFVGQIRELQTTAGGPPVYINDWDNEQFLINYFSDCKVLRKLDYNGMPY